MAARITSTLIFQYNIGRMTAKHTGTRLLARSLAAAASAQFHQSGGAAATDSTTLKPVLMLAV